MKINNIDRNILYLLGEKWLKTGTLGPFETGWIFDEFSDIPEKNMKDALMAIKASGYVKLTSNLRGISLTKKGVSHIKFLKIPNHRKFPVPGILK
jgi:hypothetical protein